MTTTTCCAIGWGGSLFALATVVAVTPLRQVVSEEIVALAGAGIFLEARPNKAKQPKPLLRNATVLAAVRAADIAIEKES